MKIKREPAGPQEVQDIQAAVSEATQMLGELLRNKHQLQGGTFVRALMQVRDAIRQTEHDWCSNGGMEAEDLQEPVDPTLTLAWD